MIRPRLARRAGALLVVPLLGLVGPAAAPAHVVYGRATLGPRVGVSDLAARVRIVGSGIVRVLEGGGRRPVVEAEVLETFKGETPPGRLRFFQHGHGVAEYESGEEALVFLQRLERHRELAALAGSGDVRWVSLQEHDAKYLLTPESRDTWREAVRAYVGLDGAPDPAARRRAWKRLTLDLLRSPEPRLAASALNDMVMAGDQLELDDGDLPELLGLVVENLGSGTPAIGSPAIGIRTGVLAELERRRLVEAPEHWASLLRHTRGEERLAVVKAAAAHPSPQVTAELEQLLDASDPSLVYAAVLALGARGNDGALSSLGEILAGSDERLRMAAVRALGRIATPATLQALEEAARQHPDPATRRRARAELRALERGEARP